MFSPGRVTAKRITEGLMLTAEYCVLNCGRTAMYYVRSHQSSVRRQYSTNSITVRSSDEHEEYVPVLKSSYDYVPRSKDEIEIKEDHDQLLLLVEKTDDECVHLLCSSGTSLTFRSWWKVKPIGVSDVQCSLVPSAYVDSVSARWTTATCTCRGMRAK
jgi:hypothetical protein